MTAALPVPDRANSVAEGTGPLDELFGALADPTRRTILQRLLQHGPDTATRLSVESPMSRQAIVKHLQALAEAGLVSPARDGREVRYTATPERLALAVAWLLETSPQWDRRVERLRSRAAAPTTEIARDGEYPRITDAGLSQ